MVVCDNIEKKYLDSLRRGYVEVYRGLKGTPPKIHDGVFLKKRLAIYAKCSILDIWQDD